MMKLLSAEQATCRTIDKNEVIFSLFILFGEDHVILRFSLALNIVAFEPESTACCCLSMFVMKD